jgi:hypothetical protein
MMWDSFKCFSFFNFRQYRSEASTKRKVLHVSQCDCWKQSWICFSCFSFLCFFLACYYSDTCFNNTYLSRLKRSCCLLHYCFLKTANLVCVISCFEHYYINQFINYHLLNFPGWRATDLLNWNPFKLMWVAFRSHPPYCMLDFRGVFVVWLVCGFSFLTCWCLIMLHKKNYSLFCVILSSFVVVFSFEARRRW